MQQWFIAFLFAFMEPAGITAYLAKREVTREKLQFLVSLDFYMFQQLVTDALAKVRA